MPVIRLKRLIEDEPPEALIVYSKRQKLDTCEEPIKPEEHIFKFVGTAANKDDGEIRNIANIITHQRTNPKTLPLNTVQKLKTQIKENSKGNRFKLVNAARGISADLHQDDLDVYDAEDNEQIVEAGVLPVNTEECITCNGVPMSANSAQEFVYDYYFVDGVSTNIDNWGHVVEIECYPLESNVNCEILDEDEDKYYDEDDSNSESNFRNDYPDESDHEYEEDEDYNYCINKMAGCLIDHNYGSSRITSDSCSDDDDLKPDKDDDERYGKAYAMYKTRLQSEESD